jgi:outer membrane receptor protein involved in Fe transport
VALGSQYWNEDVDNDSKSITAQASGSHCFWNSSAGFVIPGVTNCPGYTETGALEYQQLVSGVRSGFASPANRETEHYSFYGVLDFEVTNTFTLSFEGRFNWEELTVQGPVPYDAGASGGPGGLNPCGIFFRPCEDLDTWLDGGNYFPDQFFPWLVDGSLDPAFIDAIPDTCTQQDAARVQRSILDSPFQVERNPDGTPVVTANPGTGDPEPIPLIDPVTGRLIPNPGGTDLFNPWCVGKLEQQESWWAPKVILDWAPTDSALIFASWSRARKPGGFSTLTIGSNFLDREIAEFEPEKMDVWEVGAKTEWFDSTLRVNGAFFFQDFTDKQVLTSALGNDGRLVSKIENASAAEVWGAEVDVTWAPIREFLGGNWRLSGGYQWLDSEYKDFRVRTGSSVRTAAAGNCVPVASEPGGPNDLCEIDFSGNDLENSPDGSFSGQIKYERGLGRDLSFFIETDVQWVDERFTDETNISYTDDIWNTDFRIGLQSANWDALLYVNNVFDDDTIQTTGGGPGLGCCFVLGSGIDLVGGSPLPEDIVMVDLPLYRSAFLRPPRVVGIRGTYRFGGE